MRVNASRSVRAGVAVGVAVAAAALVILSLGPPESFLDSARRIAAAVFIGLSGGLAGFTAAKWSLRPIDAFAGRALDMARADFDGHVEWNEDEFRPLAEALEDVRVGLRMYAGRIARRAIEFEGTLEVLDLATLLRLVRAGRRSGALVLQRGGEAGIIFWRDGEILGAALGSIEGRAALAALFNWEKGHFKFSPGLEPAGNLGYQRWESLLLEAARKVDNQRLWARVVPRPDSVAHRTRAADHIPLRQLLTADEMALFQSVDGRLTVVELAKLLGRPEADVWKDLFILAAIGAAECDEHTRIAALEDAEAHRGKPWGETFNVHGTERKQRGERGKVVSLDEARRQIR